MTPYGHDVAVVVAVAFAAQRSQPLLGSESAAECSGYCTLPGGAVAAAAVVAAAFFAAAVADDAAAAAT